MPIFEYLCEDCGTRFEKLIRNGNAVLCPSCGESRLTQQFSTFAAPGKGEEDRPMPSWERGMSPCSGGMCQTPDICGRN